jgi:hypothetical protein
MVQKVWISIHKGGGLNPKNLSCVRDVGNFISPGLSKTFEYDFVPLVQKCPIKIKYFRMQVQTGASMCYKLLRLWTKLEWMGSYPGSITSKNTKKHNDIYMALEIPMSPVIFFYRKHVNTN